MHLEKSKNGRKLPRGASVTVDQLPPSDESHYLEALFDRRLFEVLLHEWIRRFDSASFSSFCFFAERDLIRGECLSLLPNPLGEDAVPLSRFPFERFCIECVGLMRERLHMNMCFDSAARPRVAVGRVRTSKVSAVPAALSTHFACVLQTVRSVVVFRAGQQLSDLQMVLCFHQDPVSGRFFTNPLFTCDDVALCVAKALWRVRCLRLDRSLFYLLLGSLSSLLRSQVAALADEASASIGSGRFAAR